MTAAPPGNSAFAAVIFDLDGVLVDSEPIHLRASRRLVEPHTLADHDYEQFIGTTTRPFMEWLIERYGLPDSVPQLTDRYTAAVTAELEAAPVPVLPGARTLLRAVRARGLPLALCSQSIGVWVDATLRSADLEGAFDTVVPGEAVRRGKPAPDLYLHAAQRLAVDPARCLAIEDSSPGVRSARAAGMTVVQTRGASSPPPPQPQAAIVLASLEAFEPAWLDAGLPPQ